MVVTAFCHSCSVKKHSDFHTRAFSHPHANERLASQLAVGIGSAMNCWVNSFLVKITKFCWKSWFVWRGRRWVPHMRATWRPWPSIISTSNVHGCQQIAALGLIKLAVRSISNYHLVLNWANFILRVLGFSSALHAIRASCSEVVTDIDLRNSLKILRLLRLSKFSEAQ